MSLFQATVACRQMGFPGAVRPTRESEFGRVSSTFALDDVDCEGHGDSLDQCTGNWANENCGGGEGAGVVCLVEGQELQEDTTQSGPTGEK